MQVVILCGGLGTRLKEETEYRPKPMIHIGSRPILWHIMKIYSHYGYKDFILSLGYKGEMIKDYFYHYEMINSNMSIQYGSKKKIRFHSLEKCNWKIDLVDTGSKAFKGARIKRVEKYIKGDVFMVTYGDGVADVDINRLTSFHKRHGKIATVTGVYSSSRFGELAIKGEKVISFIEKPKNGSSFINGGFFVFNREFLDCLNYNDECDLEVGPLEKLAKEGQLMVYKHKGSWMCMDTYREMEYLNKLWRQKKAFWQVWKKE